MAGQIEFPTPNGGKTRGYRAGPEEGPGILVIQEWWGVTGQIQSVCERFADQGYAAIAPDLYDGKVVPYHDATSAGEAMQALDFERAVGQVVAGAARELSQHGPVGITGFCMGGVVSVLAAAHVPELKAAVPFYGLPPSEHLNPEQVRIPIQGHFANRDQWITPAMVDEFEIGLKAAHRPYEFYRYDADHAFMNEDRPESYDPDSARLAWDRCLAFFKTHLRG